MYHSITFIDETDAKKNTWDNWYLIPTSRPVFNPPKVKEKYIEIPGSSNVIDLCEAIRGYPVYENRTGSVKFIVDNGHRSWDELYSEIVEFLNGRTVKAILEDDLYYYYEGRFTVGEPNGAPHWSEITIEYELKPYKKCVMTSIEDWLWNPFNFDIGVIPQSFFKEYEVSGSAHLSFTQEGLIGRMPVCPTITVASTDGNGMNIWLYNEELGIEVEKRFPNGTSTDERYIFSKISSKNPLALSLTGNGKVTFDFRNGRL